MSPPLTHPCIVLLLCSFGCAPSLLQTNQFDKVWAGDDIDFKTGSISPDGRYLSDINWDTGDLRLIDLETNDIWDVTGQGYDAGRYAWTSAFSPDGGRLAVAWYVYDAGAMELSVMNRDGTDSRVLVPADEGFAYVDPVGWSGSADHVLVATQRPGKEWQIGLVTVADGSLRILRTVGWHAPGGEQSYPRAYLSPDDEYVVFDYRPDPESYARGIYAVEVESGHLTTLVSDSGANRMLGWLPGGRGLLFYSDRGVTPSLWRLAEQDGKPVGEPELVHPNAPGLAPLGPVGDRYAFGVETETPKLHTAAVELSRGQVLAHPGSVDPLPSRNSWAGDWSPDGDRLAHIAHDPYPSALETLVIRTSDGDLLHRFTIPASIHTSNGTFEWENDSTIVLFGAEGGRNGIYRADPRDGSFERLPERVSEGAGKFFGVGPGGRTIYVIKPSSRVSGAVDIVARDARTERVVVTTHTRPQTLTVSPEGDEIAYIARGDAPGVSELRITSLSGNGDTRTVYRTRDALGTPVGWTRDGSRLAFTLRMQPGHRVLSSVSAHGEEEPIPVPEADWSFASHSVQVHPDGQRVAFISGRSRGEIWLLGGF